MALVKNKETGNLPSRTCGRVHATTGELYKITEIREHLSSSILPGSTLDNSDRIPSDIPEYRVHLFCHPCLGTNPPSFECVRFRLSGAGMEQREVKGNVDIKGS